MRYVLIIVALLFWKVVVGQTTYKQLEQNSNFTWITDSSLRELIIHYQAGSWVDHNIEKVKVRLAGHVAAVNTFIGIKSYQDTIHLFVVDSRAQMKLLVGHETNGSAFYQYNSVTGIASANMNSIYSNHEFFHVIAMNLWGVPEIWINEGMAVYADNRWHGHDLYELAKYLRVNNRYVSLKKLITGFRNIEPSISYPLTGSFVKYLDEVYGRDIVIKIWKGRKRDLKSLTGKSINELESGWLSRVDAMDCTRIKY